jgi:hypothetical protein
MASFALAAIFGGCKEGVYEDRTVHEWARDLVNGESVETRKRAATVLLALSAESAPVTRELLSATRDESREVRLLAIQSLRALPTPPLPAVVERTGELISDADAEVATAALFLAADLGVHAASLVEVIARLPDTFSVGVVAEALSGVGTPAAIDELLRRGRTAGPAERGMVAEALIGHVDARAEPLLRTWLTGEDAAGSAAAGVALLSMGKADGDVLKAVTKGLADGRPSSREWTLLRLRRVKDLPASLRATAEDLLHDEEPAVRLEALRLVAQGGLSNERDVKTVLGRLSVEPDVGIRVALLYAMGSGDLRVVAAPLAGAIAGPEVAVQLAAMTALSRAAGAERIFLPVLMARLGDPDRENRLHAVRALRELRLRDRTVILRLEEVSRGDADWLVRAKARDALGELTK